MPLETELKLSIDPCFVNKIIQHPMLQAVEDSRQQVRMRGIYLDTSDHALRQANTSLRVRHEGHGWVQTVKGEGKTENGLHQRQEWEMVVDNDQPVYDLLPQEVKEGVFSEPNLWSCLQPLFETDFQRTTWQLKDEQGNHVECCLDQGQVKTSTHNVPISELELELKQGDPLVLFEIALQLQTDIPLKIENISKAARGYQLHKSQIPLVKKLTQLPFKTNVTIETAFINSCHHALAQLQDNEQVLKYHNDYAGLCAYRQGLQQLQATLYLYRSLLNQKSYKKFKQLLKQPQKYLDKVRYCEWLLSDLAEMQCSCPKQAPLLANLHRKIAQQRRKNYIQLRQYLYTVSYSRLLLRLSYFLMDKPIISHSQGSAQLFATEQLAKHYRKILSLPGGCRQDRHAQRLAMNLHTVYSLQPLPRYQRLQVQVAKLIEAQKQRCISRHIRRLLKRFKVKTNASIRYFMLGWYSARNQDKQKNIEFQ